MQALLFGRPDLTGYTSAFEPGVTSVVLVGLALDYCVKFTALDAREEGFAVTLVKSGTRAVELTPGDADRSLGELRDAGVTIVADEAALGS